ncbi:MAG: hypothetical protein Q8N47_02600 [Bryobacterales bacterium]|nr:hypothetical protein [Bryobacterales bacterium]
MPPSADSRWAITFDVEWAHPEVLDDVVRLLAERNLRATFFCTHDGIALPGHERALHPNFRRQRNSVLEGLNPDQLSRWTDIEFYRFVVRSTRAFCPEAVGVRAHCRFYDHELLPVYREAGFEYDSTDLSPLSADLAPEWKGHDILALPMYYMDHWDLGAQATDLTLPRLQPDRPGLKIVDFHPNLVFLNAASIEQYRASKPHYREPVRLRKLRHPGRGVRTLLLELLDFLAGRRGAVSTLGEVNAQYRKAVPC